MLRKGVKGSVWGLGFGFRALGHVQGIIMRSAASTNTVDANAIPKNHHGRRGSNIPKFMNEPET